MNAIGGPIVIVHPNYDDRPIIADLFRELNHKNELVFFHDGREAFEYLKQDAVNPFLILSDITIPPKENFEFRTRMQTTSSVSNKGLPYLFYFDKNKRIIYV
jgi:hypothetical protein